jgi:hypothetical protein
MQETRYIDEDGSQCEMHEFFCVKEGDRQQDVINRMNKRLFELEEKGHALVRQQSFSEMCYSCYEEYGKPQN